MFLGHFATGLLASRAEPRLPLGTAFLAAQIPDVLWPFLLLSGIERVEIAPGDTAVTPLRFAHYPWSHSLLMTLFWGAVAAFLYRALGRARRASLLLFPLVAGHWVLDFVSHRSDMPLFPSGPFVGLGLWNSVAATVVTEGLLFMVAVVWFAKHGAGLSFWTLITLLTILYAANLLGPPPPTVTVIAIAQIALVPLLWWWGNRVSFHSMRVQGRESTR
jgi:hypothetical protein